MSEQKIIKILTNNDIPAEILARITQDAFLVAAQKSGVFFSVANMTPAHIEKLRRSQNTVCFSILVNDEIAGYSIVAEQTFKNFFITSKCLFRKIITIDPKFKGLNLGEMLQKRIDEFAQEKDIDYIFSDTPKTAKWNVNWHLRNGYRKFKLQTFSSTNYYSVCFRKSNPPKRFDCFSNGLNYAISIVFYPLFIRPGKNLTILGRIYQQIKKYL